MAINLGREEMVVQAPNSPSQGASRHSWVMQHSCVAWPITLPSMDMYS